METWVIGIIIVGSALFVVGVVIGVYYWYFKRQKYSDLEKQSLVLNIKDSSQSSKRNSFISPLSPVQQQKTQSFRGSSFRDPARLKDMKAAEEAQLQGLMYVRSTSFSNPSYLGKIGTRDQKHYFSVEKGKDKYILTMTPSSANRIPSGRSSEVIAKLLLNAKHPYVLPTAHAEYSKDREAFCVFRPFIKRGSIRDLLNHTDPLDNTNGKYTLNKTRPLTEKKIAKYGRQILEGMQYFKLHGFPFSNLHAGNVILDNNVARLTDYESDLIGVESRSKKNIKRVTEHPAGLEMIGFASVLYEMAVGYELDSLDLDDIPNDCPLEVEKILKKILDPQSGITFEAIAEMPFFAKVVLYSDWDGEKIPLDNDSKQLLTMASSYEPGKTLELSTRKKGDTLKKTKAKKKGSTMDVKSSKSGFNALAKKVSKRNSLMEPVANNNAPAPPPPPTSSAPPPPPAVSPPPADSSRSALLTSIESFSAKKLRKATTNDRSKPKI